MSTKQIDLSELRLFDHHCHSVTAADLDRRELELLITEASTIPPGVDRFHTQVGMSVRRWCAPVLGLEPFASADAYVARRQELGGREASRRLLAASGIAALGLETGIEPEDAFSPDDMATSCEADWLEIIRLERETERLAQRFVADGGGRDGAAFLAALDEHLRSRLAGAIGVKSIAAYRIGLDFNSSRPSSAEAVTAFERWLGTIQGDALPRLTDATIIRMLLWWAIDHQTAIQLHIGYGDDDVDLHRCNPLLLSTLLRETASSGARFMLLHCYPFHREAGYLADVFPHVYCDVGLAINYTGARSSAIIAESLELTPFSKVLFSTDAFGAAELYLLGTTLFHRGLARTLQDFHEHEDWPLDDCHRIAEDIAWSNAIRAYQLTDGRGPTPR